MNSSSHLSSKSFVQTLKNISNWKAKVKKQPPIFFFSHVWVVLTLILNLGSLNPYLLSPLPGFFKEKNPQKNIAQSQSLIVKQGVPEFERKLTHIRPMQSEEPVEHNGPCWYLALVRFCKVVPCRIFWNPAALCHLRQSKSWSESQHHVNQFCNNSYYLIPKPYILISYIPEPIYTSLFSCDPLSTLWFYLSHIF